MFLILSEHDVVLPLAYVILTGDTSLSLPATLMLEKPELVSDLGLCVSGV